MSDNAVIDISVVAGADLSSYRYYPVTITTGEAQLAGANDACGILQNDPKTGEAASIRVFGISLACANGATDIAMFDTLGSDSNHLMVKEVTDNDLVIGYALEAYTDDATAKIQMMVTGRRRY